MIFLVLVLSFQLISSAEIVMNENFSQGETLIAKVSANFIQPITKQNIFFYEGSVLDSNFQVSLDYDVVKLNEDFYVYAILLNKNEGAYSMTVENAEYREGTEINDERIVKNFSITSAKADFYVKPGVISASDDFSIEVQNLNANDIAINVNTNTNISGVREIFVENAKVHSLSLNSGEIDEINFQLGAGESSLRTIELKTNNTLYEVLVYMPFGEGGTTSGAILFSFEPSVINFSLPANSVTKKVIYLYNSGNSNLTNISLYLSDSLFANANLSQTLVGQLDAHSSASIELSLYSSAESNIEGELNARIGDTIISSSVFLQFAANYVPSNVTEYSSTKNCAELNGTLYDSKTEKCSTDPFRVRDGICCLGTLQKISSDNTGKIIAGIIIALVLGGLIWFYFAKYRKTKKPVNLLKIAEKTLPPTYNRPVVNTPPLKTSQSLIPTSTFVQQRQSPSKPLMRVVEKPIVREIEKKIFIEKPKPYVPKYIGSTNRKVYHLSSCKFSKLIEPKYKVQKDSEEYFKRNKYKPCKMCMK